MLKSPRRPHEHERQQRIYDDAPAACAGYAAGATVKLLVVRALTDGPERAVHEPKSLRAQIALLWREDPGAQALDVAQCPPQLVPFVGQDQWGRSCLQEKPQGLKGAPIAPLLDQRVQDLRQPRLLHVRISVAA